MFVRVLNTPLSNSVPDFTDALNRTCSIKKIFLKNSQNSQENTFARVSFLVKMQAWPETLLKKRFWLRYFPASFAKFLRTPFLKNSPGRLLLILAFT